MKAIIIKVNQLSDSITTMFSKRSTKLNLVYAMLVTIAITMMPQYGYSQSCANYTVARTTGNTYTSIVGSGAQNFTWRNTTSNQNDDNRSFQTSIGFDFWYLGVRYTQFSADLNGFIDFSSSTSDGNSTLMSAPYAYAGNYQNVFTTANASMLSLAPMYDDLWTSASGATPIASSLVYKTSGTAPNRLLTVEWINFDKWNSSTGSINFQLKLYETTGVIEYSYGTMTAGSLAYVYVCGINSTWASGAPTAAQLLTQQTANTATFNSTPQNNLATIPASNSKLTFTPTTPSAAPTSITFSSVTKTSMNLNWSDNASNEVGYVIYNSTDNVNFNFVSQTAANATTAAITGLNSGTTYYWKVYAITDGKLSSALSGTRATSSSSNITSNGTGLWSVSASWVGGVVPTTGDNVTIANTHTITLDANVSCNSITIGQGSSGQLTIGNDATSRVLTVSNDITINAGATLTIGSTASTHTLVITGNISNAGTVNLAPTGTRLCNVTFNKNGSQNLSGAGTTNTYNNITLNMGTSSANVLNVSVSNFIAASNFLTLTNGTFKLSANATITPFTSSAIIPANCGLWSNSASAVINTTAGSVTVYGFVRSTLGTINIGNATDNNLTSYGGTITIDGGAINIAGRLDKSGPTVLTTFSLTIGTLKVATVGSTSSTMAPFNMDEVGSTFNMSDGVIIIERPGTGNLGYINTGGTVGSVTGGTLQIGDASTPASQTFLINSSVAIANLTISNGVAVTAQLATNGLTVLKSLLINAGTFNANSLNVNVGLNITNNGTLTTGANTITLNGTALQTIGGTSAITFNNLTINNSSKSITFGASHTINGDLTLTSGIISVGANTLTLNGNFSGSATNCLSGNGSTSNLAIGGTVSMSTLYFNQTTTSTTNRFANLTVNRNTQTITLGNTLEVIGTVTLSNGTLSSAGNLTLVSNSSATARIAQVTGTGAISGNVIVQRFLPGGAKNRAYRFLSSPASGQSFANSWQQYIHITGPGTGGNVCPSLTQHTNGFDANLSAAASIYTFDETTGVWNPISNTNATNLSSTTAYRVFVRGNRTQGCSLLTTPYATAQDVIVKATGTITTGSVTANLTYTANKGGGWNFVSNPYPSAIDWNNAMWVSARNSNINSTIYIWNPASGTSGQYASWNPIGGSVNGGTNIIQSGQSFFVRTTIATTLSFQEAYKSTDQTTQVFGKTGTSENLKIQLFDTAVTDETVIFTYAGSTFGLDNLDGLKMSSGVGTIGSYTTSNTSVLTFNSLPPFATRQIDTINLKTVLATGKTYKLNFIGQSSFKASNVKIYLFDRFTGLLNDMSSTGSYSFYTNSFATSYSSDRFYIVFADPTALPITLATFKAVKEDRSSLLVWSTSSEINNSHFIVERSSDAKNFIEIANVKGAGTTQSEINYMLTDEQPDLNGINYYRLKQVDFNGAYTYSSTEAVDFSSRSNTEIDKLIKVWPNPIKDKRIILTVNNNPTNITVTISDVAGRKLLSNMPVNATGNKFELEVNNLQNGVYIITVFQNGDMIDNEKLVIE
ncbi:MAG: T9SS type A sorting domain-containing protein [Bacteroidota bacterium]